MPPCNLPDCDNHAKLMELLQKDQDAVVKETPAACRLCDYFIGFDMFRMIQKGKRREGK
jgi:hypothetical protein